MILKRVKREWDLFWMRHAGLSASGRIATRLATWFSPPYKARCYLAHLSTQSYVAPSVSIHHDRLRLDDNVFIGDRVVIYQAHNGGPVKIGRKTHLHCDTIIETGSGGSLTIGTDTHIQPRCQLSAYKGSIKIGSGVQIAPNCAFYPYNHGMALGAPIKNQPFESKGGIVIDDDAWLGVGVVVLDGVKIGKGAVVGAGSVVTCDIPDAAIAAGVPARVLKMRSELTRSNLSIKKRFNLEDRKDNPGGIKALDDSHPLSLK
ncbi:MAG: DapH/DapD/GlmU-related protein [Pseudomonadota bacterium]